MKKHVTLIALSFFVLLSTHIQAGNNATYEQRKNDYIDSALLSPNGHKMIFQAFRNVPVDTQQLNTMLNNIITKTTSDFDIIQLIRILNLTSGQYDAQILPVLYSVPYWINYNDTVRNYWSENHMIMWMGCDWLLHEKYNKPIDSTLRKRLVHYLDLKNEFGYYEFNSSTYAPYSLSGLLNLADFAQDTIIKNGAATAAQRLLTDMLLFTNDLGAYFPVAGRNYPGKYYNPFYQNHSGLIYLLTGKGAADNFSTAAAFLSSSSLPVDTVIHSWQPKVYTSYYNGHSLDTSFILNSTQKFADRAVFQWSFGGYFHPAIVSNTVQVLNDSALWDQTDFSVLEPLRNIITPSSAPMLSESLGMASKSTVICEANITLFKNNSITLSSVSDFWKGKAGFQQYTCVANVGTSAVYVGSGEVFADWEDRSPDVQNTHLPYVAQKQNVALLMYRPEPTPGLLPAYFQNKDVALHWRNAEFDETVEDSLWLLGRQQERYVAVRRSCIGEINGVRACPTSGGQTWVIVVGDSSMYGSFSAFGNVIHQAQFAEEWSYDSVAGQSIYYASVTVDTIALEYAWGVDSVPTGFTDVADALAFSLYPNPAQSEFGLTLPTSNEPVAISIRSMTGELVYEQTTTQAQIKVSSQAFATGLYVVECRTSQGSGRKLLSVQQE